MKKFICLLLICFTVTAVVFTGCGEDEVNYIVDNTSALNADLDYSKFNDSMTYDIILDFTKSKDDYTGKTVKLRADYGAYYDYTQNTFINVIEMYDSTACCASYYEVRLGKGVERPSLGSSVEIVGTFTQALDGTKYLQADAISLFSGSFETSETDIDATDMNAEELAEFAADIGKLDNEYTGKTVRIFGNYTTKNGYSYVTSYYRESPTSNSYFPTWSVELHSADASIFPEAVDGVLAYEFIGTVSSYTAEDGTWPCIEVTSVRQITTFE